VIRDRLDPLGHKGRKAFQDQPGRRVQLGQRDHKGQLDQRAVKVRKAIPVQPDQRVRLGQLALLE
jgi:hypothetical protein